MMQYDFSVEFQVKNVPVQLMQEVYLELKENNTQNINMFKMQKINQYFMVRFHIKPETLYHYKYKILYQNEMIKEEQGYRNLFNKQNLIQDQWSQKVVKLRIYTTQKEIMKTLQIKVDEKNYQKNIIHQQPLELKKVMNNNKEYYEQSIFVDSAIYSFDFFFIFNAIKYDTNRNEQKYIKKKTDQYLNLKTVGNQSIIELQEKDFYKLSLKPRSITESTPSTLRKSILDPHLELSNEKVQKLQQIFENSLRYFRENLEIKDLQIKQLKLEKLEYEDIIFFNYQDSFQQDHINDYLSQFNKIVEDYKKDTKSFLSQYTQDLQDQESTIKESTKKESTIKDYKEKISNKEKTIETLVEKVKQLKNSNTQKTQVIQDLEDKIMNFKKQLKNQRQRIDELEDQLTKANQQIQVIAQQKDQFKQQIIELDVEIQEYKRTNKDLEKQNQITSKEKEKISLEKQAIDDQLYSTRNEIQNFTQNQKRYEDQLKNAKYLIGQYQDSSENEANIIKESRNILVKLIFKNLKDLKDIIHFHKEQEIKDDSENLKNQLSQIELKLKNFVEEKTTLSQVEEHFQLQVLKQLQCLCDSNRIKQNERKQINDTQNCLNLIIEVLKKFDKIKDIMPTPQPNQKLLLHQPTEVFNLSTISPKVQKLQRMGTQW